MKVTARIAAMSFVLACFASAAMAQEEFRIFGLPLGAKLPYAMKPCSKETKAARQACWAGRPSTGKDKSKTGTVTLPDNSIPQWAERGEIDLSFNEAGVLYLIEVTGFPMDQEGVVSASIERRFAGPSASSQYPNGSYARWGKAEVEIELICPKKIARCTARFLSGAERKRLDAAKEAEALKRLLKPQTP